MGLRWRLGVLVLLALAGCPEADIRPLDASAGVDAGARDAAVMDAGRRDAGETDAGGSDAAISDAGTIPDAGAFEANLVFVTSRTVTPETLGGLSGADDLCNELAMRAGLPDVGGYVAWLSSSDMDAVDRLGSARGWVRRDGEPFVDTTTDLVDGRILAPASLDENGDDRFTSVITATSANGRLLDGTCSDWGDGIGEVRVGRSTDGTRRWTSAGVEPCNRAGALYCFGTGQFSSVRRRSPEGRLAFHSRDRITGTSGRDAMDALCNREATLAGFGDRTFVAFVSTSLESAVERLSPGASWYRPDGVLVARDLEDLNDEAMRAPVNPTADLGEYRDSSMWAGSPMPSLRSPAGEDCDRWTTGSSRGTRGMSGAAHDFFGSPGSAPCTSSDTLLCFER